MTWGFWWGLFITRLIWAVGCSRWVILIKEINFILVVNLLGWCRAVTKFCNNC